MNQWPKQSECVAFYGNPKGPKFEQDFLTYVPFPWMTVLAWNTKQSIKAALVNKKCAESLQRVFTAIWDASGHSQDVINSWGLNKFGGGYCLRTMRGGNKLSMHAYGCAVDFDPLDNAMGDTTPEFATHPEVLKAFADEGWVWGGNWRSHNGRWIDGMHFQSAIIG